MTIATIEQEILKDVLNNPGDTFYENVLSDLLDYVQNQLMKRRQNNTFVIFTKN
jgi:hypothetical protein